MHNITDSTWLLYYFLPLNEWKELKLFNLDFKTKIYTCILKKRIFIWNSYIQIKFIFFNSIFKSNNGVSIKLSYKYFECKICHFRITNWVKIGVE
jgi:hypothetical protein